MSHGPRDLKDVGFGAQVENSGDNRLKFRDFLFNVIGTDIAVKVL